MDDDSSQILVQMEIKNAALRHMTLSCQFGAHYSPTLVMESANYALQICSGYDISYSSDSHVDTMERLLGIVQTAYTSLSFSSLDSANHTLQELLLHSIELKLHHKNSAAALELIEKGLQVLLPVYQKALWQKKLLILSSQGTCLCY